MKGQTVRSVSLILGFSTFTAASLSISAYVGGSRNVIPNPGSTAASPSYALLDLTNGMSPVKLTDSSMVLLTDGTHYYTWAGGTISGALQPANSGDSYQVKDMDESGNVIGSELVDISATPGKLIQGTNTYIVQTNAWETVEWGPGATSPGTPVGRAIVTVTDSSGVVQKLQPDKYGVALGGHTYTSSSYGSFQSLAGSFYLSEGLLASPGYPRANWWFMGNFIWNTVYTVPYYDLYVDGTEQGNLISQADSFSGGTNYSSSQSYTYEDYLMGNKDGDTITRLTGWTNYVTSATTNIGSATINFAPSCIGNEMTAVGGRYYAVGTDTNGAPIYWCSVGQTNVPIYDGMPATTINGAVTNISGTTYPAPQMVYGNLLAQMNSSGNFQPPYNINTMMYTNSGFSNFSAAQINDYSEISGTAVTNGVAHAVLLLPVQINAYRPQMVPNSVDLTTTNTSQMIVPPSEVSSSGVHIRVNGDSENSNLLEVTFSSPALATMTGMTVTVQRSSSNLNVWTTSSKGAAIIGTGTNQGNLTLDSTGNATIWVEALAQGGNDLTFLLTSGSGTTTIGTLGKLHFVNYDSMAMAFSGETFFSGNPLTDGMFSVAQNLYLEGYNIAYYDVHTINSSSSQPAYGEISNEISSGFVTNVGVFGYSHGGGETYNMCSLLSGTTATITFAGYVDAIEYAPPSGTTDFFRQTTYPPGASYMWNYYQTNSHLHSGPVTGANVNVDVTDTSWGASLTHAGSTAIMRSPNVQAALQGAVESNVPKY